MPWDTSFAVYNAWTMQKGGSLSTPRAKAGLKKTCRRASRGLARVSRTFWSTHALNSGRISGSNFRDFLVSCTFRARSENSYIAAAANTAAHAVGNEVLGAVVNDACSGDTAAKGSRLYGKKLGARRLEFVGEIRASVAKYQDDNGRLLLRDLLNKRNASQLETVPLGEYDF